MKQIVFISFLFWIGCSVKQQGTRPGDDINVSSHFLGGNKSVVVYTTAKNTKDRLSITDTLQLRDFGQPLEKQAFIIVDPSHTFQTFLGIGGAITDAAAETFYKLPKAKQQEILQAYYDPQKGIGYTLARTNINSCDFSSQSYTYVADNDTALKTFNIKHDAKYRIPLIKAATKVAGGKMNVFASPWSPPAWMKDNDNMLNGGASEAGILPTVG